MTFIRGAASDSAVREAVVVPSGRLVYRCRIIRAGLGSSGWYVAEALERDGATAFPIGTKSYWNHPTSTEEWERPERDAKNIAAVQVSEAEWDADEQALFANFEFNEGDRDYVEQFAERLAMSIYAWTESEIGTIGDYTGRIHTKMLAHPLNSVDVVTVAGAGGAILTKVSESLRERLVTSGTPQTEAANSTPTPEGVQLDQELKDALGELATSIVAGVKEALAPAAPTAAKESNADILAKVDAADLPAVSRKSVFHAVESGIAVDEAIATEKQYVEAVREGYAPKVDTAAPTAPTAPAGFVLGAPTTESAGATAADQYDARRKAVRG